MSDSLFNQTSAKAGQVAARSSASRRMRILDLLAQRPMALWELADAMGVFDHQISGRITELARDGLIETSGERRVRPGTKCEAEVWRLLTDRPPPSDRDRLLDAMGLPLSLVIEGDLFDRAGDLILGARGKEQGAGVSSSTQHPTPSTDAPGIPYTRRPTGGGAQLIYRIEFIECPGCGRPLKMVQEQIAGKPQKLYKCGTLGCARTWYLLLVNTPGGPPTPALVMRHL